MTPELSEALGTSAHWMVVLLTMLLAGMAIGLHYEALQQLNRRMPRWNLARHPRVLVMMFCILAVHILEIWMFGLGIYLAVQVPGLGQLVGVEPLLLLDAVYASATAYTTLGYGDLVPRGAVRFLFGTESLIGLLLITWSASFAYLEMQRYWRN
ncbi:MAG TPA: ion channel [Steroidobacteraceae bacterium]